MVVPVVSGLLPSLADSAARADLIAFLRAFPEGGTRMRALTAVGAVVDGDFGVLSG